MPDLVWVINVLFVSFCIVKNDMSLLSTLTPVGTTGGAGGFPGFGEFSQKMDAVVEEGRILAYGLMQEEIKKQTEGQNQTSFKRKGDYGV